MTFFLLNEFIKCNFTKKKKNSVWFYLKIILQGKRFPPIYQKKEKVYFKSLFKKCDFTKLFKRLSVDPAFRLMRFPLDGKLDFYFEKLILFD